MNKSKSIAEIEKRANLLLPKRRHTPETDVCLLIDGMWIAHTASHSYRNLSFNGKSTSILYGFPQMLKPLINHYRPAKVVVAWDGMLHPKRMELLPEYKQHRLVGRDPEKRAKFEKQIARTRKLLLAMGIPQAWNKEVEGDDMIYKLCQRLQKIYRIVIVSGDNDFYQEINHDVSVYNPRNKQAYTTFAFICDCGVEVPQWIDFKILAGDTADDIPGYRGIGEVKGRKFLSQFYSIKHFLDNPKASYPGIDKEELWKVYRKGRVLMDLGYFDKAYNSEAKIRYYKKQSEPEFDEVAFREICMKYRLTTLMTTQFMDLFKK